MEQWIQQNLVLFILLTALWTIPWKAVALWQAARRGEKVWFVVLLIINTLAILEIFYIFVFSRRATYVVSNDGTRLKVMRNNNSRSVLLAVGLILFVVIFVAIKLFQDNESQDGGLVTNFEECVKAGNPVMESYPRRCMSGDRTFAENIGNELEKNDLIRINFPRPNGIIISPLIVEGEARGAWFF